MSSSNSIDGFFADVRTPLSLSLALSFFARRRRDFFLSNDARFIHERNNEYFASSVLPANDLERTGFHKNS